MGEGEIIDGRAGLYKAIVVADVDWLTQSCHRKLVEYQEQGGVLLVDKSTEVPLPFSRDEKVKTVQQRLREIAFNTDTPDDSGHGPIAFHPQTAHRIHVELDRLWRPFATADSEDLVVRASRAGRTPYLWLVDTYTLDEFAMLRGRAGWREKQAYLQSTGAYGGIVERKISVEGGPYSVYDVIAGKPIPSHQVGDRTEFGITLQRLGGTLVGLYPSGVKGVRLEAPDRITCGDALAVKIRVGSEGDVAPAEYLPLEIRVEEPDGTRSWYSRFDVAHNGELAITIPTAKNDHVGRWTVRVTELSSGVGIRTSVRFHRPAAAVNAHAAEKDSSIHGS